MPNDDPNNTGSHFAFNPRFPGQYFDAETNTHYNTFRDYDPGSGRYMSPDPIGLRGGLNPFVYARANPLKYIDPTGLRWIWQQSTGNLYYQPPDAAGGGPPALVSPGGPDQYAGQNEGLNNPANQSVPGTSSDSNGGPLPQGNYTIGPQQNNVTGTGTNLPGSMRLTPDPNNEMYGRGGFLMHGDNSSGDQSASEGCPIVPRNIRNRVGNSGDPDLTVVP